MRSAPYSLRLMLACLIVSESGNSSYEPVNWPPLFTVNFVSESSNSITFTFLFLNLSIILYNFMISNHSQ